MNRKTITQKISAWYRRVMNNRMIHGVTYAQWWELHGGVASKGIDLMKAGDTALTKRPLHEQAYHIHQNRFQIAERCLQNGRKGQSFVKAIDDTKL
jgi:hypothetical protein